MGIKFTPAGLWREIRYADEQNKRRTASFDSLRKGFHTPYFSGDAELQDGDVDGADGQMHADPENHAYEFASYVVPQLVAGDPKFGLKSRRTDPEDEAHDEVKALEHALNQWVHDADFRTTMDALAPDPLFAFGAVLVSPLKNKATYQQSMAQDNWPDVQRISPRNFLRDPAGLRFEECRYFGHRWVMDAADLKALAESEPDAGWDMDAVEELEGVALNEDYRPKSLTDGAPMRGEVELFEMWFPTHVYRDDEPREGGDEEDDDEPSDLELTEKDGFRGTIYTLAVIRGEKGTGDVYGTTRFIRKPRAYYGHKSGPYAHIMMMRVPDDPWGLAPLVATQGQSRDLNALTRAQNDDIRSYKKLVFVEDDDNSVTDAVENFPHRTVVPIKNVGTHRVADKVSPVEVGGPSAALQAAIELAHARLRRNSGMGEAQTGQAPGSGTTATAVAVASQDAMTRLDRMKEQWRKFLEEIALKVAFYIGTSDKVEIILDTKAVQELGGPAVAGTYKGGGLAPADFENMQVVVDVVSVERTSEERVQARLMQATGMLMESIPMVMQVPAMGFWHELFAMLGNTLGVPDMAKLGDELVAGALAVLSGDIPSLATMEPPTSPGVDASPGKGKSAQRPAPQFSSPSAGPKPGQSQNRTPGLSNGVSQPTPLAGVGGSNAR